MTDAYNLHRFLTAQGPPTTQASLNSGPREISTTGSGLSSLKSMGLGHSSMARQFAIALLDETKAYMLRSQSMA